MLAHSGPIYNRGEAARANRRERRPIKWKKIGLAVAFMGISSGMAYGAGCVISLSSFALSAYAYEPPKQNKTKQNKRSPTPRAPIHPPPIPHANPSSPPQPQPHSKAWLALKYPSPDLPARDFLALVTNLAAYVMSSSFFIRESTLVGEFRSGRDPPPPRGGRRPA